MKLSLSAFTIALSLFGVASAFDVEYCTTQNNQGECFGIDVPAHGFACNDVRPGFENLIQQVVIITANVGCVIYQGSGCTNTSMNIGVGQQSYNLPSAWIDQLRSLSCGHPPA
ncbi:hypothetical protein B0H16DRAFT_1513267 [Mycena metata]|uniref:Uncharacterized protein n=1 Tax=Mycena metata TaxID=1033252 RepID=A0AAD7JV41_9AGAR|nr:hypothetical protein B0H16DRAFT_1513267 [Mycena metata]